MLDLASIDKEFCPLLVSNDKDKAIDFKDSRVRNENIFNFMDRQTAWSDEVNMK